MLSPDYVKSRYARDEWTAAFAQERLLPVRVREVKDDELGLLRVRVFPDLVGLDERTAQERLVAELKRTGRRVKPRERPPYPGTAPQFPGPRPTSPRVADARFRFEKLVGTRVLKIAGTSGKVALCDLKSDGSLIERLASSLS